MRVVAQKRVQILSNQVCDSVSNTSRLQLPGEVRSYPGGDLLVSWVGFYHMQCWFSSRGDPEDIDEPLFLGFADGGRNAMVVKDPSGGRYRLYLQLEDLYNKTGRSLVFAEQTLSRSNLKVIRDLGGWIPPSKVAYLNCGLLYQYVGAKQELEDDDLRYLSSLNVTVDVNLQQDACLDLPWTKKVRCNVPTFASTINGFAEFLLDSTCISAFSSFSHHVLDEVLVQYAQTTEKSVRLRRAVMFGCSVGVCTAWAVAILLTMLGFSEDDIVAHTTCSARAAFFDLSTFSSTQTIELVHFGIAAVSQKYGSMDGYVQHALRMKLEDCMALRAALLAPLS